MLPRRVRAGLRARAAAPERRARSAVEAAARAAVERTRVVDGSSFRLADFEPDDTGGLGSRAKGAADRRLAECVETLRELQRRMYADGRWAVLLVFQALDAAGKDGTIARVLAGVDPHGLRVESFKQPSREELAHDFLWRTTLRLPRRGHIGVFNRSYYEETLTVRVRPELLEAQGLPRERRGAALWTERFEDIRAFERHLDRSGTLVRKFFLHVSKEEQRRRLLARIDEPEKNWKFAVGDVGDRALWAEHAAAYEETIRHTATASAPWFVVPADHKWFTRLVVAEAIVEALESIASAPRELDGAARAELAEARERLEDEPA